MKKDTSVPMKWWECAVMFAAVPAALNAAILPLLLVHKEREPSVAFVVAPEKATPLTENWLGPFTHPVVHVPTGPWGGVDRIRCVTQRGLGEVLLEWEVAVEEKDQAAAALQNDELLSKETVQKRLSDGVGLAMVRLTPDQLDCNRGVEAALRAELSAEFAAGHGSLRKLKYCGFRLLPRR